MGIKRLDSPPTLKLSINKTLEQYDKDNNIASICCQTRIYKEWSPISLQEKRLIAMKFFVAINFYRNESQSLQAVAIKSVVIGFNRCNKLCGNRFSQLKICHCNKYHILQQDFCCNNFIYYHNQFVAIRYCFNHFDAIKLYSIFIASIISLR